MMNSLSKLEPALNALQDGQFVLVYDADGREEETDFIIGAEYLTSQHVHRMRHDGGGLIFLMVHHCIGEKLGLPFLADVFAASGKEWPVLKELIPDDIPYDTKSSFSITINHRETFTGVTDKDRSLTMREFAFLGRHINKMSPATAQQRFGKHFRAPGHIPICLASHDLLADRQGHTELSVALGVMAGITPVMAGCEMMDVDMGLSKKKAQAYAKKYHLPFLEGKDILTAWEDR
jgi:3,4-dihydroxy 2-butanone 4-phosphate synthase